MDKVVWMSTWAMGSLCCPGQGCLTRLESGLDLNCRAFCGLDSVWGMRPTTLATVTAAVARGLAVAGLDPGVQCQKWAWERSLGAAMEDKLAAHGHDKGA